MDQMWTPPGTHELTVTGGRVVRYCSYGPPDGYPVVSLSGTPGTRWERPDVISGFEWAGLRVIAPDRPGYGGSTRQPGRRVADVAADVRHIADAQGWRRFAVTGFSGGGPHALACAAVLASRVTRCAVVSCPAPFDASEGDQGVIPGRDATRAPDEDFRLAGQGEQALRPYLADRAVAALTWVATEVADPDRRVRLRAMYEGLDGWIDDDIALVHPWGFDLGAICVPVGLWRGADDSRVPRAYADWLLAHIPAAQGHEYPGGHDPGDADYRQVLGWLATR
jgi:pimeloyl-ACP methyl ester carboxylesterase